MTILETVKARASLITFVTLGLGVFGYEWRQMKSASLVATALAKPKPSGPTAVLAEGRLVTYPDAEVTVSAEVSGKLSKLLVHERDTLRAGEPIAELDVAEQRAALREARARVKEAEADVDYLGREKQRSQLLFGQHVVAQAELDKSVHEAEGASLRRSALLATVARLATEVDKASVTAPLSGTVTARFVTAGAYVAAGTPLVTLTDLARLRVEAEIGEFDAGRVALGSSVVVRAEGYDGTFRGRVEEIPDRVVTRQMKPLDPARPVDTRVLLVKVRLEEQVPFRLGQRVEVEIRR